VLAESTSRLQPTTAAPGKLVNFLQDRQASLADGSRMLQETSTVFVSQGVPLIGTFLRDVEAAGARQPALVIAGSWLNVKEQMAMLYARRLAAHGFTCFVFDFAGWGQSGGALRHAELPSSKAVDLASAARFVAAQSFVDAERVGFVGVCASAQYGLRALAEGARFHSYASIAGWFHDADSVAPFYGGSAGVARRLQRAAAALDHFVQRAELVTVPAYAPGDERAGMSFELDYYGNPARGAVSAWKNQMAELSWPHWLHYDGLSTAAAVSTPALLVHSDGCALPDNAKRVHSALRGPKHLAWLDGNQQDYYDQPAQVDQAVAQLRGWFEETLR